MKKFDVGNWDGGADAVLRKRNRDKDNKDFLKGSNCPPSLDFLSIVVEGVRLYEDYDSVFIIDFHFTRKTTLRMEEADEDCDGLIAKAWNVNVTNATNLRRYLRTDNFNELEGAIIRLKRVMRTNPRTEELVPTFIVYAVKMRGKSEFVTVAKRQELEMEEDD